ncbi:hypothetical protein DBR32_01175 [Taibaiella sp. KBW10]|uniref:GEVED domain-containing protein n=1 Tax=Taibaiella sp. KBW10 TaxID=2153357 RepID=UPI000F58F4DE|nr:GEVED domain-containing protein [Taibaiella sp. KBW10]RQO32251.1 hypothetical protein DBR32_01175 [Taibaiella sp. KBW10]
MKKKLLLALAFAAMAYTATRAQIALPYTETFASIATANGFPTVTGGAWTRSGTAFAQPTYIANQIFNRSGNGDTKYIAFSYIAGTRYFFVGPFTLTAGTSYTASVLYKADGDTGFGPLALTYGTAANAATQTNTLTSVPANITNAQFQTLSGTFTPATSDNYYMAIKCTADGNPWYLTLDDYALKVNPSCLPPTGLNATATFNTATLNWSAATLPASNGYDYYYSTSNTAPGSATIPSGSTAAGITTASISSLTANTTYYFWVRSKCSTTDISIWSAMSNFFTGYCTPTNNQCSGEGVTNVTFGTLNNTSDACAGTGGYSDYTTTVAAPNIPIGATTPISVGIKANAAGGAAVWIDFNKNGNFEAGECTILPLITGSGTFNTITTGDITVPATALPGTTRMRVRETYGTLGYPGSHNIATTSPCLSNDYTEFEDYTVNLFIPSPPPPCVTAPTAPAHNTSLCKTTTGTTLSWPAVATAANYDVYLSNGVSPTPILVATVSTNTYTTAAVLNAGTYYWKIIPKNLGGSATGCTEFSFTVSPVPTVALGNDTTLCLGNSLSLNAGNTGSSYNWSTGATTQTITTATAGTYSVKVTNNTSGCFYSDTINVAVSPIPTVFLGNDTAICAGSNITLNAANSGSSYLWSTGATTQTIAATTAGSYWVRVTNAAGCQKRDTIQLTLNPLPIVNLGNDLILCAGSNTTLNAGNPGAAYLWNTGQTTQSITVTTAGSYWVRVTNAAGCAKRDTVQIAVSALPVVALGNDTTICADGSITLSAGNPGASYLWSTGATTQNITATTAASYWVRVTNNSGCVKRDTIQVAVSALPVVHLGNDTTICTGVSITLDAANPGNTYLWNTGATSQTITVQTADTYSVATTNMYHCVGTDSIAITVMPDPINLGFNFIPLFNEAIGKVRFEPIAVHHSSYTYSWNFGDGQTSTLATPTHTYAAKGDYEVSLTTTNACKDTVKKLWVHIGFTTGTSGVYRNEVSLNLYPNPAKATLTLQLTDDQAFINNIIIYTVVGQKILEQKAQKTITEQVDIHQLPAGIYILKAETNKGLVIRKFEVIR